MSRQLIRQLKDAAERARLAAGGPSALARKLGGKITPQAVGQWSRIPAERVQAVAAASGIPPHELRPDLFPAPAVAAAVPA